MARIVATRCVLVFAVLQILLSACEGSPSGSPTPILPKEEVPPLPPHDPFVGLLFGSFEGVTESRGQWIWGDSVNVLCHQWSRGGFNTHGWFYGTNVSWSSADIYVLGQETDPLSIIAAENFDFTVGSALAQVGDTVFFRGRNGFFGAWTIGEIVGDDDDAVTSTMSGTWYFRADGGGDFTGERMEGALPLRVGVGSCDNH